MTGLSALLLGLLLAVIGWPRLGLWSRWREARRLAARAQHEDALKHMLKCEANGQRATVLSIAGALRLSDNAAAGLLRELETRGLVSFEDGRLALRPEGRELGLHIVRAHRLWESYLAEETGIAEARWHKLAERQEHLALLARWGYSSWRDGEWLPLESWSRIPYRRLVNMVHRVATSERP